MSFAELMGEPGRPAWPLWELLKWMVGKSDHTMAAIGKRIHTVYDFYVFKLFYLISTCRHLLIFFYVAALGDVKLSMK